MARPLLLLLLVTALGGVGLIAVLLIDDSGTDRRDRDANALEDPEQRRPARVENVPEPREPTAANAKWAITGFVKDEAGRPIPGATVLGYSAGQGFLATTDRTGEYGLAFPEPAATFDVYATGYLPAIGFVNGRPLSAFMFEGDGPWTRDFTLKTAASLTGRVMNEQLQPVGGAEVYVVSAEHVILDKVHTGNVVRTRKDGTFTFPGLAPGRTDVGVRAAGYLPAMARDVDVPERGSAAQDLILKRGRTVTVKVINASPDTEVLAADSRLAGKLLPPGGLRILAIGLVGREFIEFPVYETRPGAIGGLPAGPVDFEARDPLLFTEPGIGSVKESTDAEVELKLIPRALLAVLVLDSVSRQPLEARITRSTEGRDGRVPVGKRMGRLDLPGDERRYTLHFELEGYNPAELKLPTSRREPVEVLMQPVAEGATGSFYLVFEPALKGRVAVIGRDVDGRPRWLRHVDTQDEKGRWEVTAVPIGEYTITVLASGAIPVVVPGVVVSRSVKSTHRVRFEKGGGLEFKVTDEAGQLLDKVHVQLLDDTDRQIDVNVLTNVSEGRAFVSVNYLPSAASARADSGLAPGVYRLTVVREGYRQATTEFAIRSTEVAEVAIALSPR